MSLLSLLQVAKKADKEANRYFMRFSQKLDKCLLS